MPAVDTTTADTAIIVLVYIVGAFSGVLGVLYFLCKDDRPIADQLRDIQRMSHVDEPTEHGRVPL
jgi:hypothetical protein